MEMVRDIRRCVPINMGNGHLGLDAGDGMDFQVVLHYLD
jgi:hypothetical protein